MPDRSLVIRMSLDVQRFNQGTRDAVRGLNEIENAGKKAGGIGDTIKKGLALAGVGGGIAAVVTGVKSAVGATIDFQKELNTVKAVGNATADQMAKVAATAQQLGTDTSLAGQSASTAAQAMAELTKGGLDVDAAMAAARGTLQLATAAQIDGASAATIQANALNTFGLKADQAAKVADLLSNAANKSSGEITDFAQALNQGGLVAAGAGISIQDTVTALAEFAQAGLKGSDAGTSLKTAILALQTPTAQQTSALSKLGVTVYDAQGNFEGLEKLSGQLATAQKGMSQEAFNSAAGIAFGSDAVRAAQVFAKNGAEGWQEYAKAMAETGSAAKLAGVNTEGLPGKLAEVQNAAEGLALEAGNVLAPVLSGTFDVISGGLSALSGLADGFDALPGPMKAVAGVAIVAAILAATGAFRAMRVAAGSVLSPLTSARLQIGAMREAAAATGTRLGVLTATMRITGTAAAGMGRSLLGAFGGPWGLAITAGITALTLFATRTDDAVTSTADLSGVLDESTGKFKDNAQAVAAKALADSGALDIAEKANLNLKDYTGSVLRQKDASDRVTQSLLSQARATLLAHQAVDQTGRTIALTTEELDKYSRGVLDGSVKTEIFGADAKAALDPLSAAYQQLGADSTNVATRQRQARQAIDGTGESAEEAAKKAEAAATAERHHDQAMAASVETAHQLAVANKISSETLAGYSASSQAASQAAESAAADLAHTGQVASANNDIFDRAARTTKGLSDSFLPYRTTTRTAAEGISFFGQSFHDMSVEADTAEQSTRDFLVALDALTNPQKAATDLNERYTQDVRNVAKAHRDAAAAADGVKQAEINLAEAKARATDENYSEAQKVLDVAAANRALADANDDVVASQSGLAEKADKVRTSLAAQVEATYRQVLTTGDSNKAADAAATKAKTLSDNLVKNAKDYGLTTDEAKSLVAQMKLTPKSVKTTFETNAAQARKAGMDLYQTYDSTTGKWSAQFLTLGDAQALQKGGALVQKYLEGAKTWTATLDADDGPATRKTKVVQDKLLELNKVVAKPQLDAEDYATRKIAAVKEAIAGFNDKTVKLTIEQINLLQGVADSTKAVDNGGNANPGFATGGLVSGPGTGTSDSIPAWLSNKEFVVNAKATAENLPLLHAINAGKYAAGGLVVNMDGSGLSGANATNLWSRVFAQADKGASATKTAVSAAAAAAKEAATFAPAAGGNYGPPNSSGEAANTAAAINYIRQTFGISDIGGWSPSGSVATSDHPRGKALDAMIPDWQSSAGIAKGDQIASYFIGNPSAFGTKYVIWRNRINEGGGWAPYIRSDGGNLTDPTLAHMDHVHVSFLRNGGRASGPDGKDNIPAWLSDREFVVNADATARNLPLLEAINAGRYAAGGLVLPSRGNLGGTATRSPGTTEGISLGALGQVHEFLVQINQDAKDLGVKATESHRQLHDASVAAQQVAREQAQKQKDLARDNAERLGDARDAAAKADSDGAKRLKDAQDREAKTADQKAAKAKAIRDAEEALSRGAGTAGQRYAKILRENAERTEAATRAQDKANKAAQGKVDAAKKEYEADSKAAAGARQRAAQENALYQAEAGRRAKQLDLARQADRNATRLAAAEEKLQKIRDDRAAFTSGLSGKISGFDGGITGHPDTRNDPASILAGRQYQLEQGRKFGQQFDALKGKGLNQADLRQILDEGPGSVTLGALSGANKKTIAALNTTRQQIDAQAKTISARAGQAFFGTGQSVAQGIVNGLKHDRKLIDRAMDDIANSMLARIKAKLGIKSPSQVFRDEVGIQLAAGVVKGIDGHKPKVDAALTRLVSVPGVRTPIGGRASFGGSQPVRIEVILRGEGALTDAMVQEAGIAVAGLVGDLGVTVGTIATQG